MKFCDRQSDDLAWVVLTYLLALLPWSMLTLWDPITEHWQPYWFAFTRAVLYLVLSIVPYFVLVPYAVLQGCSVTPDPKELLTSIVAIVASLWNVRRSFRGLLGLYDVYLTWKDVNSDYLHFCFPHLLPEVRDRNDLIVSDSSSIQKCPIWNVLVSSALVDNDWPGDAPRVKYIRACGEAFRGFSPFQNYGRWLPSIRNNFITNINEIFFKSIRSNVYAADKDSRRSMIVVWVLWMVRRSIVLPYSFQETYKIFKFPRPQHKIEQDHSRQYYGEGDLSSKIEHSIWKRRVFRNKASLTSPVSRHGLSRSSNQSTTELMQEKLGFHARSLDSALIRVISIWKRRSEGGIERTVVGNSEIEKQLSSLPTESKDDLSLVKPRQIAELEMHLPIKGRTVGVPVEELCDAFWLPRSYSPVLSNWIRSGNFSNTSASTVQFMQAIQGILPAAQGILLASTVILLILSSQKFTFALEDPVDVGFERLWNPKSGNELIDSESLIECAGAVIGSIDKALRAADIVMEIDEISRRHESYRNELKTFMKSIFGENWNRNPNSKRWHLHARKALESLQTLLSTSEMPKVADDEFSAAVVYRLLPFSVYFCFLRGFDDIPQEGRLLKDAAEATFTQPEHWIKGEPGRMTLEYKEQSADVSARFESVDQGKYIVTVSFQLNTSAEISSSPQQEFLDLFQQVKVGVAVEAPPKLGLGSCKCFEIEPLFLQARDFLPFLEHEVNDLCDWISLKFFNIIVASEESTLIVTITFSGPKTYFVGPWISIGSFEVLPMTEHDLKAMPGCRLLSARKCTLRLQEGTH